MTGAPPRLCRLTQFINFMPTKFRSEKVLAAKAKCVRDGASMNHWAALGFRVPLIAFPAWTEKAKEIPVIVPHFEDDNRNEEKSQEPEEETEIEEVEEVDTKKKKRKQDQTSNGKRKKKSLIDDLPNSISSLL